MRLRLLVPLTLFALGAVIAPACSSGDDDTAASTSNDRDSDADSGGDSSGGSSGSEDTTDPEDFDLGDIPDEISGLGEMSDCFSLAATYGSLYFEALGGGDGAKGAEAKAEQMKEQLPESLHDDIDVIADAIGTVAEEGIINGSDALDTDEYNEANDAISKYFEQECDG